MMRYIFFLLLLNPFDFFGQSSAVQTLNGLENEWMVLGDWNYQKGDNLEWANPEYDDSSWAKKSKGNLTKTNSGAIAKRNEIVWFRKKIMVDTALQESLVLNISQTGASEIYLDGKLIHRLGSISTNADSVVYYNPYQELHALPLIPGKEQVLAVRFANGLYKFPLLEKDDGYFDMYTTTLKNANTKDAVKNWRITSHTIFYNNYRIALGMSIFTFILFVFSFLFFPSEKINGYFALACFFLSLFIMGVLIADTPVADFWMIFCYDICALIHLLLILYCTYKIFKRKLGFIFWSIVAVVVIIVPCFFIFPPDDIAPLAGILVSIEIIRISVISLKANKIAALCLAVFTSLNIIFWVFLTLYNFSLLDVGFLFVYIPFSIMLSPLGIAIYLGYSFGLRSKALRMKLAEVEQLSIEKQQILSTQNETLEKEVTLRTADLNSSLENLKATQAQLIQSEKMASLGELTAGIAHEIQNPLNFVNNFSELSNELLVEMNEEIAKGDLEEAKTIAKDIKQNLEKINHHGKRADAIVKGMLQHSRKSTAEKEPTDINKLADESFRLAYHGLRAKDKTFNATLNTDFDTTLEKVEVIPQDLGRVFLNLFSNAFYAVKEKKKNAPADYEPTVTIATKQEKDQVIISVKDNGNGIPADAIDKIFQPFFTTKPTGQGTGLGLSMSYDIVKAHHGKLEVETLTNCQADLSAEQVETYTIFKIKLPNKK